MLPYKKKYALFLIVSVLFIILYTACSNQKNTSLTRSYHSINTRYNIHFNANEAYKEALLAKYKEQDENLTKMLHVYPDNSETAEEVASGGAFTTTIDKTTKAIKLHSIKTKPQRDAKRRGDVEYQAWLKQKEFTPFLDQTWLLLAKAEFEDGDYLRSISTFMYITKIYGSNHEIVTECRLWIARAYTEMGWIYEAGNILYNIELERNMPDRHKGLYAAVKANYLIQNKEYREAIPHLEVAIKHEKNKTQKTRMKYLLGQIYMDAGEKEKAYQAFGNVKGLGTPYKYTFNAQLYQLEILGMTKAETLKTLEKMAKSTKNKDYQDQIYFTLGNIYLQKQDTVKAIDNYKKAIKESIRNGYDKALNQIALGDIYFDQRKFIPAQPNYSEALGQLKKTDEVYPRVSHRSAALDELVVYVKVYLEQDSLQHLAGLPEEERMKIIDKKIEDLKKQDKEEEKERQLEKQREERNERISGGWNDLERENLFKEQNAAGGSIQGFQQAGGLGDPVLFYFYNAKTVEQGKIAFQKQWGNRKFEDDWRRRNKAASSFDELDEQAADEEAEKEKEGDKESDGDKEGGESSKATEDDRYNPQYYIQQLPFTKEALKESDDLIENALFNMGRIYKNKLEDFNLAIDAYTTDIRRFPQTPNLEEIYFQLFLIYMQMGNNEMMALYRSKLLVEFAEGKYAVPLSDPDYEWNFKHMASLQESLYDATYTAYLGGDVKTVRDNYKSISTKYPFGDLMPNFALLNALSYAQTRDLESLSTNLKALVEKYPKSDVAPLATEILGRIKDGQVLLSDGSPIRSLDWNAAFETEEGKEGEKKKIEYSDQQDAPHLLLMMAKVKTIDRNNLLYQVADYNFSNYVVQLFDLKFESNGFEDVLEINGFEKFANIKSYVNRGFEEEGLFHHIDTTIMVVPISESNYEVLPRLGMKKYIAFFTETYGKQLPNLIEYWNTRKVVLAEDEDTEVIRVEDKPTEVVEPKPIETVVPKDKEDDKPVVKPIEKNDDDKKDINAEDILTEKQVEVVGKADDLVKSAEEILSNPVDGIKNILTRKNNKVKLTKEEKAALKVEQQEEKARQKELKAIEKAKQDSISKLEKIALDSVKQVEKLKLEQVRVGEQAKIDAAKEAVKAKEDARKQKENTRKDKLREQTERRKLREQEQKAKQKAREQDRKEREKVADQLRKQKAKEAEERRKQRHNSRTEY